MAANLKSAIVRWIGCIVRLLPVVALLAACGGGGGGEPERVVTSVTITSPRQSLVKGESVQLTAVARDQSGDVMSGVSVTWSVSVPSVAAISPAGLLQALTPGAVVATATVAEVAGSLPFTIVPRSVASVAIVSPTATPKEGDALQLSAVVRDQSGNTVADATVTWSSSDTGIASVSAAGLVNAYSTGTATVTAKANGTSGTLALTITPIKVAVTVGAAKEVVFRWATDRCLEWDGPDQPARLVRAEDGSLVLFAGIATRQYVSRGADFNSLRRDCTQPALVSVMSSTPDSYENLEWLWAVYREGTRWHALIHNEYHDPIASTCNPGDFVNNPCWYNSITYAVSTDGARSFTKPNAPAHVVAPAPNLWVPPAPGPILPPGSWFPEGYRSPSNIVRAEDGYYYALFESIPNFQAQGELCVMRTDALGDPASWRAWDGNGFNLRMTSPYVTGASAPLCTGLTNYNAAGHLTYNTYLRRYMQVAQSQQWIEGRSVCGIFFSLSSDLIHWSKLQLLAEGTVWDGCELDPKGLGVIEPVLVGYSSIIDHSDSTTNFERAGRTPYLYYTRFNWGVLDRDLVRVPITFTRID